jgi:hypothetical protein
MPKWSKWQAIDSIYSNIGLLGQKGIYQIRMVDSENKPIPIPRLAGMDLEGIVYIGKSIRLHQRIEEFSGGRHSGGGTYFLAYRHLMRNEQFRNHSLQFRVLACEESALEIKEANLLRKYFRNFCELPPLNSTVPGGKKGVRKKFI